MKNFNNISINLLQLVGAIVFILWCMGKVPYGPLCWIIPYGAGTDLEIIARIWKKQQNLNLTFAYFKGIIKTQKGKENPKHQKGI